MILSCVTNFLYAAEQIAKSGIQRSIVKQLRYIDANTAKEYLVNLDIGTNINKVEDMNALIITTRNNQDREKASALIGLIDSKTTFELIRLNFGLIPGQIVDISDIQAKIKDVVLGTFSNPPASNDKPKAIIDVQGSSLIMLVPKGYAPPIVTVLEKMYGVNAGITKFLDATKPAIDLQKTDPLLSAIIAKNNERVSEDDPLKANNSVNAKLLKSLAALKSEAKAITVTEKVEAEPAVVSGQMVLPKTLDKEIEAKAKPVGIMTIANDDKKNEPTIADLVAKIEKLESDNLRTNVTYKPSSETRIPVGPREDANPEPVKKISSESKPLSGLDKNLSEAELEMTIDIPTKVLVIDLLKLVGEHLRLNYMYDPKEITGEVTLFINDGKIKVGQLYALLENVLQFRDFVMTRRGRFVTIVPRAKLPNIDPKIIMPGEAVETGNVVVTQTFKLEHIDTKTAMVMLDSMKLGLSVQDIPQMQSLIITGYASRMERISEVLKMVDKAGKERLFQFRNLKYTIATNLAPKIQTLAKELGTVSITIGSKTAAVAAPPQRSSSAAVRAAEARRLAAAKKKPPTSISKTTVGGEAINGSVYLDIDDRTNRILMIGLTEGINIVGSLIDSLDIPQSGLKEMRQYKIVNVEASYVIDILGELGATTPGARPINPGRPTSSKAARAPVIPTTRGASSSDGPQISLLEESNTLLINASPEEHDRIVAIIQYVDIAKQDLRIIKEYEIESVDTSEILNTMLELGLISTMPGSSSSTRRTNTTSPTSRTPKTPTSMRNSTTSSPDRNSYADPISGEPMIAVLEAANSLLINATSEQHTQISMLIAHIDRDPADNALPYVIYALTSQTAAELKLILDEVIHAKLATSPGSSSGKKPSVPATAKIMSTPKTGSALNDKDRIEIVDDENTNSLIVYASKKNQTWIGKLIEELDEYRPQVLLDVTLVEITKDDQFNFDLDLISKYGGLNPGGAMTTLTKAGTTGISALADFGTKATEGSVANGLGKAFYADNHIQALLGIMDKKGYGRVLARPSLLVKDNEVGEIKATKTIYVGQAKSQTIIPTTGQPSVSKDVKFEPFDAGITLNITPHIASNELMQLEIILDRTDFDPSDTGEVEIDGESYPKPLDTISSNVTTWAILPDGATIILGGIETISQTKGVTKVPLLGDIPIIGTLFRGINESNTQSKLYVFVKAHIISPGDELTGESDIERISMKKRMAFEDAEKQFQGLRAVPGIKPNPIPPVRILEDDDYLTEIRTGQQVGSNVISIPVVRPAATERDKEIENDEYLRKIRDAKIKEIEESAVRDRASDAVMSGILPANGGYIKKPRARQLMGSTTRVEVILPN